MLNKKQLAVVVGMFLVLVSVVVGLSIWQYIASLHQLKIANEDNLTFDIQHVSGEDDNNTDIIATISTSKIISIKNGKYCAVPTDKQYDQTPECVTINNSDVSLDLQPSYSDTKLESLLKTQLNTITKTISSKYGDILDNYIIKPGKLYNRGEYYATTLTEKTESEAEQGDVYRIILEKKNDTWTVLHYPELAVNKYDYPSIPRDILDSVNRLVGYY